MNKEINKKSKQVIDNFSFQWKTWKSFPASFAQFREEWLRKKLDRKSPASFKKFILGKHRILDAGTGVGYKLEILARINPQAEIIGIDISDAILEAKRNTARYKNVKTQRADIFNLPFPKKYFDLIICDGVLHHTPDARKAFDSLAKHLAPGGHIAIHVYKKMGPIREFTDDYLRAICTKLSTKAGLKFCEPFTHIGKYLDSLNVTLSIPKDIPSLSISAGKISLQRFVYYTMFQCHWNRRLNFKQNNLINFDWFHPVFASRHTHDEVFRWFHRLGLIKIKMPITNESGVTAIGQAPK